jgi:hypothetical protein
MPQFFDLPAEIRFQIYQLGDTGSNKVIITQRQKESKDKVGNCNSTSYYYFTAKRSTVISRHNLGTLTTILRVNRAFHQDAANFLYGATGFEVRSGETIVAFLHLIGPLNRARLVNITLHSEKYSDMRYVISTMRLLKSSNPPLRSLKIWLPLGVKFNSRGELKGEPGVFDEFYQELDFFRNVENLKVTETDGTTTNITTTIWELERIPTGWIRRS